MEKMLFLLGTSTPPNHRGRLRGGSIVKDPFGEKMEDLMVDLDLLDPPLKNGKYTWSNKRTSPGHIVARLDRFLLSSSLLQSDLIPICLAILSATSDHKPIYLSLAPSEKLGPIPFHFKGSKSY